MEFDVNTDDFFENAKRKDLRCQLKKGLDVNARTTLDGMTMLHRAVTYDRPKLAHDLLTSDVFIRNLLILFTPDARRALHRPFRSDAWILLNGD